MSDFTAAFINVLYLAAAQLILNRLKLKVFKNTIFFVIGLLLFDIPLAFFGYNTPEGIQWLKSIWWFYPLGSFIALVVSLALRSIFAYIRGKTKKEGARARLFLGCASVTGSLLALVLIAWFTDTDPEVPPPQFGEAIFLLLAWVLATNFLFFGAVATKSVMNK